MCTQIVEELMNEFFMCVCSHVTNVHFFKKNERKIHKCEFDSRKCESSKGKKMSRTSLKTFVKVGKKQQR